jgi:Swiss Army Knife RNA repair-like protein
MTMRILFLDIDGVLNNPGTYCSGAPWRHEEGEQLRVPIEPSCMTRLNRLIAETGARVVISSSWRLFARWEDLGPALTRYGLVGEVIGETPDLVNDPVWLEAWRTREGAPFHYERLERGMEIAEWLKAHPEVEAFAILDDCSDMAELKPQLVLCDPVTGLDDPDVERAKWLLGIAP